MVLKVADALKPFSRIDPDSEACRDLRFNSSQLAADQLIIFTYKYPVRLRRGSSFLLRVRFGGREGSGLIPRGLPRK